MRHAVEVAMKGGHTTMDEVVGPSFIEVAADFQALAEEVVGQPLGSPGRAFAAVRTKLPTHLRSRVQKAVRERNGAGHPARADPELLREVKLCFDMLGSECGVSSTAEGSCSDVGLSSSASAVGQPKHAFVRTKPVALDRGAGLSEEALMKKATEEQKAAEEEATKKDEVEGKEVQEEAARKFTADTRQFLSATAVQFGSLRRKAGV